MRSPVVLGALAGAVVALVLLVAVALVAIDLAPPAARVIAPGPSGSGSSPGRASSAAAPTAGSSAPAPAAPASGTTSPSAPPVGLAIGDLAPSLVLPRLGGGTVDLASYRGRPVWVNFIATWCPDCRDELPMMEAYASELGTRLAIVLVDVREDSAAVAAFAAQLRLDLPIGLDEAGTSQRAWAAYALPVHVWIDASGLVRSVGYGELGPPQFHLGVARVLPGVSLSP